MKLFTEKQVGIATFLGGPLPPGMMIYYNFKKLGMEREANVSMAISITFTSLFFYGVIITPTEIIDKIPDLVFTGLIAGIVYILFRHFMGEKVEKALEEDFQTASNWLVAGITSLGVIITLIIAFGFAFTQNTYPGEAYEYNGNTIFYESEKVTPEVLNATANELTGIDYFGMNYGSEVHLTYNNGFVLTIPAQKEYWEEVRSPFAFIEETLEFQIKEDFIIRMESFNYSGNSDFGEINRLTPQVQP